jgi:hypothetical protein
MSTTIRQPFIFSPSTVRELITLQDAKGFNIPIYQRLYAWSGKEIGKMLSDFYDAFQPRKDYYIGNITLNFNQETAYYDIIDGQQRLTTLWLIALVMKLNQYKEWDSFLTEDGGSLLSFTAREQDTQYLRDLSAQTGYEELYKIKSKEVNPMMRAGIKTITSFLKDIHGAELKEFSSYIFEHVRMVAIFLPNEIDLNKYFEDMNNRGLQLEPHHIIKAELLSSVDDEQLMKAYAGIWDAVSQMNRYLEYNLKGEIKDNRKILQDRETAFSHYIRYYRNESKQGLSLEDLIGDGITNKPGEIKSGKNKGFSGKTGSIINFQEFLLHCLKISLAGKHGNVSLDDKQLLNEFTRLKKHIDVTAFIKLLFDCRVLYDEFIIKSIDSGEGTKWEIRKIKGSENEDYIRDLHFRKVVQIQSMLNVSVALSLWFTDALYFLIYKEIDESAFLLFLEEIDFNIGKNIKENQNFDELLNRGTDTARYWFYKLDYLLWKDWSVKRGHIPDIDGVNLLNTRIENFQFRDNRSVEHIEPRNPELEIWADGEYAEETQDNLKRLKNKFGNLALISISSNSSYNNQPAKDKKQDFIARTNKWGIESLKLIDAYSYEDWIIPNMLLHQEKMIRLLEDAYPG